MPGNMHTSSCYRFLWISAVLFSACAPEPEEQRPLSVGDVEALKGIACGQCHTVPSPSYMSPEDWPYLLAWMGAYVGHEPDLDVTPELIDEALLPESPLVSREQFDAIRRHYLEESAVHYEPPPLLTRPETTSLFEPNPLPNLPENISMVSINKVGTEPALFIGSFYPPGLHVLEPGATTQVPVHSEPVAHERLGPLHRIGLIGHLDWDGRQGQVVDFNTSEGTREVVVDEYPRLVAHRTVDIDGDGHDDLFVCGFGDYQEGRVGIFWGGAGETEEQVLFVESGATWGEVVDLNGNGRLDIVISVANARPRLKVFINEGERRFTPRVILNRPLGWGFNRCLIVDWDGDGLPDIVELSGNNMELRGRPLKAHHGVRVLRNLGDFRFEEIHFEPLPGAMDVAGGDFSGNGMTDLAVTAYFPDWREEVPTTFLLLLQRTDGTIKRAGIEDRHWNRWMRVAAGDATGNGKVDLLLGAGQNPIAIPVEHHRRYSELLENKASVLLLLNAGAE